MMAEPKKTLFDKLKRGLFMTHTEIIEKVKESMTPDLPISQAAIDGLEEGLLGADVGAELTMSLVERIEGRVRNEKISKMDRFTEVLREETRADLGIADLSEASVLVIVNKVGDQLTANLQGPLVINTLTREGEQMVLAEKRWTTRHPLMKVSAQAPAKAATA